jgi:hypothetical protein
LLNCLSSQRTLFVSACLILPLLCVPSSYAQVTINVPADQATIQAGINAASSGDTVLVAPGTYAENINFGGRAIIVTSSGGSAVTIIDGGANGPVVTFNTGETTKSQLSGFTIQNGLQNGLAGGGISISSASPTITGNVITGNHAAVGIGIYVNGGSPIITANTITGNNQTGAGDGGQGGGGILVSGSSSTPGNPQITGNTITNNSVSSGGNGGGISITYYSSPLIQGNLIQGNSAYNGGGGVSVQSYNSPILVENVIVGNSSLGGGSGGGFYVSPSSSSQTQFFTNNTIAGNTALDNTSGIYTTGFAQYATFTNNIVVAASGQNAVTCNAIYSSVSPSFSYNDSYSASGQAWSGICDSTSNPGNISADPLFVNSTTDFHLQSGSPAIDAGTNNAPNLPTTDFDGKPRIWDGNNDCVSTVDLGAYEYQNTMAATISPLSLVFPSQLVGSSSSPQTATMSSVSATCFQFASIQMTGEFSQTSTCPALGVPAGTSCTFSIVFTPAGDGTRLGSLTATSITGASVYVSLSGAGYSPAPVVSLSPASLVFPGQIVGTSSAAQTVTLSNVGNAPLAISIITTTGPFTETNTCPASLAAGASCAIKVVFAPSVYGSGAGTVFIGDNAAGGSQTVTTTGTGIDFAINPTTDSTSVVRGHAVNFTVDLTSLGGVFGNSVALSCSGLPSHSTCAFSPAKVTPGSRGGSSVMTVDTQSSTPLGTYTVVITGKSGALSHSVQVQLTVENKR